MPSPYSTDLRKRAMEHFERYGSATLTSQTFNISRSVIYDWKRLKKATGTLKPKEGYQHGSRHKIKDLKKFKGLVDANPGLTLSGIVKKSGIAMSIMACSRALNKLNITRKKSRMDLKKGTKKRGSHS
jgi:transposase